MAALFVALDELLPYVPAANKDFTPYLARARNHAEAIDKAFRFRLAFLRRLNEVKRVHGDQGVLDVLRAQHFQPASEHLGSAIFGDLMRDYERRVFEATVASSAKATATGGGSSCRSRTCTRTGGGRGRGREDELGQRTLDLLSSSLTAQTLKSYASRLSQFAEFCHDAENISPLEATTATVVRYVAWIAYRFVTTAELIVSAPTLEYQHDFRALVASVVNFMFFARGLTGVSCRRFGGAFLRNDRDRDGGGNRENLKTARMGRDAVAPRATFAKDATKDFGKGMAKAEAPTVDKAE
eukprot:jgi/Tetstr1/458664/TSEL_045055.t2